LLRLTKWYLDLVTDQGTALIAYAASLEWTALRIQFASTLLARPDQPPVERTAWSQAALPELEGDRLSFKHQDLQLVGEWRRRAAPIEATLLEDEAGRVHWACHLPAASATVTLAGEVLTGEGYAECLTFTRPPWTLPLRTLRWGRTVTPSHSAVWIDWRDGPPRRWVFLDGQAEPDAIVSDTAVTGLSGSRALQFTPGRELCDRRALQVLSRHLPALDTLPLGPLRELREVKRLDRGTLSRDGVPIETGWTIHEVVRW
jgi:hypothetical protein